MTQEEALNLIRSSAHYKNAGGEVREMVVSFVRKNPGEARRIAAYLTFYAHGEHAPLPVEQTLVARGIVGLLPTLPAPPPPAPSRLRAAVVIKAGDLAKEGVVYLRAAGITHVAVELTGPNLVEVATPGWDPLVRLGFFVSMGGDAVNEATHVSKILDDNPWLQGVLIDTERHKVGMGGERVWTENLYRELRARKPLPFWIGNVTFGVDAATDDAVNHEALRRHGIYAAWEAYDGGGYSIGVPDIVDRARRGGWDPPNIMLGDKNLEQDVKALAGVGDVWIWKVDNGPAQDSLRAGVVIP